MSSQAKKPTVQSLQTQISFGSASLVSQATVDQLVISFVINYMEPLAVVEDPSFVQLVTGLQPTKKVITRKTLDGELISYLFTLF
jgi:hypothetical protein